MVQPQYWPGVKEKVEPFIDQKGNQYILKENGWLRIDPYNRESFYPDSVTFVRRSGKRYFHIGRTCIGWPSFACTDTIKSMESGEYRTMTEEQLIAFKNT